MTREPTSQGSPVRLVTATTDEHEKLFEAWRRRPHVVEWWGAPEEQTVSFEPPPGGGRAVIVAEAEPIGFIRWQPVDREDLEEVGLSEIPDRSIDIDLFIGENDRLGKGVGSAALRALYDRLSRETDAPLAGVCTSIKNAAAIRAFEKAGFRKLRQYDDPCYGRCWVLTSRFHRGGRVTAVAQSSEHRFHKETVDRIRLIEGIGVDGDAHAGRTVKHRSRVRKDPTQPNLRQVHLMHAELHDELRQKGFDVSPGVLGENVTTEGVDLLGLCPGARIAIGDEAVVEVTGLRNPCAQLDGYQEGLLSAVLDRDDEGVLVRKSGIMGIVASGGEVRAGDAIRVELPDGARLPLERV